ncbi:MAG: hypothetical protein ACKVJE_17450 [Pseudomonadales bacterium]|jgi:hypothetical protein
MNHEYLQYGHISIEHIDPVEHWVIRTNEDGAPFDGKRCEAMVTFRRVKGKPHDIYICNAMSLFKGGSLIICKEARNFFKNEIGITHAAYRINGKDYYDEI